MLKKLGLDNTILAAKLAESLKSTLPVVAIVFAVCFIFIPVPAGALLAFVFGSILLVVGVGLFTIGVDMAMTPIGSHIGSAVTKSRSLMFALFISFLVGTFVTVSEPDLQVLAGQVPSIPNPVIIGAVALGVGIFLAVAMLRIFLGISLRTLLLVTYPIIIALAFFMPADYIGVAFDSGGVTTGPMTVPFIIALGVGVASSRSDSDAQNDSFGLVAISSIGPILAVMILGVLYPGGGSDYTPVVVPEIADSLELWALFAAEFPRFFHEVALALMPIIIFFVVFQIFKLRLHGTELMQIVIGIFYTYIGLVLFLTGVNAGFLPVGNYLGQLIGALEYNWVIVPLGMVIGYFIVQAEPAVHVLGKQVLEVTAGAIPGKALSVSLSIGIAVSVGLYDFIRFPGVLRKYGVQLFLDLHYLLGGDFRKPAPRRALAAWLTPHVAASGDPGAFNQAMMDLGARVCTPHAPACLLCPLRPDCRASVEGRQADFPEPPPRKTFPERKGEALILRDAQGRLLLTRHPGERLLAGFWELPALASLPFARPGRTRRLGVYRQTFSHFRLTLSVRAAPPLADAPPLPEGFCWCADPAALPLTTATRKILAAFPSE